MALDRRFGFAGAAPVLMPVQVQALALDRCFGFAGDAVVQMLVQVQAAAALVLVLGRRFVLPALVPCWCRLWLWIGVSFCGRRFVLPVLLPC